MFSLSYIITRGGASSPKTVSHPNDSSLSRISTTWSGLKRGETYTFTVTCQLQGEDCEGDPVIFTATTTSCSGWLLILKGDIVLTSLSDFRRSPCVANFAIQLIQPT